MFAKRTGFGRLGILIFGMSLGATQGADRYFLDLGPAGGPVLEGFRALTPSMMYGSETGFGWQQKGGDARARTGPDDLCSDFVSTRARLLLDLAPDRYIVHVLVGDWGSDDEYLDCGSIMIHAEGIPRWQRQSGPLGADDAATGDALAHDPWLAHVQGRFREAVFPVTVLDGQLALKFDSESACPTTCVVVFPAGDAEGQRRWQAARETRRRAFLSRVRITRPTGKTPAKWGPTAEDTQRGYALFVHAYMTAVLPGSILPSDSRRLQCFACPGEREPVAFSVRSLRDVKSLQVRVADFISDTGEIILRDSVMVRRVRHRPVPVRGGCRIEPVLLGDDRPADLASGVTSTYWLRIDVPVGALPGDYKTTVTIESDNAASVVLPWKLKVLPISLEDDALPMLGVYYDGPRPGWRFPTGGESYWQAVRDDLAFMRQCGFNTVAAGSVMFDAADVTVRDGEPVVDTSRMSRFMMVYRESGFRRPVAAYRIWPALTSSIRQHLARSGAVTLERLVPVAREALEQLQARADDEEWPEVMLYPTDEADDGGVTEGSVPLYRSLKEKMPRDTRYVTSIAHPSQFALLPYLDFALAGAELGMKDMIAVGIRGRGTKLGFHHLGWDRFSWGFYLWRMGSALRLQSPFAAPGADPGNPFGDARRGYFCALPTPDGPAPTVQSETAREGIDDLRYLVTLEKTIEIHSPPRDPQLRKSVNRARALLAEIRAHTRADIGFYLREGGAWESTVSDKLRLLVAQAILGVKQTAAKAD